MSLNVMRTFSLACFILACLFLASCGEPRRYTITAQDVAAIAGESEQQIPLRVGFYMDKRFEMLPCNYGLWSSGLGVTDIEGRPNFERAVQQMFREVVPVSATEAMEDFQAKNLDVVISIRVKSCTVDLVRGALTPFHQAVKARLAAEWSVTSVDGRLLTFTNAAGEGKAMLHMDGRGQREALLKALDAHFRKAYADIVMTGWWKDPSWKSRLQLQINKGDG